MVDFIAVIVAAIVGFIIGLIWYGALFGKKWRHLAGIKDHKPHWQAFVIDFLSIVILAYVLGLCIEFVGVMSWNMGLYLGFLAWLGFIATTTLGVVTWEKKPFSLWLITNVYSLISFAVMGLIMAVW